MWNTKKQVILCLWLPPSVLILLRCTSTLLTRIYLSGWPVQHKLLLDVSCRCLTNLQDRTVQNFTKTEKGENNSDNSQATGGPHWGCCVCCLLGVWILQLKHGRDKFFFLCSSGHFALKTWAALSCRLQKDVAQKQPGPLLSTVIFLQLVQTITEAGAKLAGSRGNHFYIKYLEKMWAMGRKKGHRGKEEMQEMTEEKATENKSSDSWKGMTLQQD